jgi:hypothetical protein
MGVKGDPELDAVKQDVRAADTMMDETEKVQ